MPPLLVDFWKTDPPDVECLCFLPNGLAIPINIPATATIRELKYEMVKISKTLPLNQLIKDPVDYEVSGIAAYASIEPFTDETKRLCEMQPYFGILRLAERTEGSAISSDYELTKMVSNMIGKSLEEFTSQRCPEIEDFRSRMSKLCEEIEEERARFTWQEKLLYENPIRVADKPKQMLELSKNCSRNNNFLIVVKLDNDETSTTISVHENDLATTVIEQALAKMSRAQMKVGDRVSDYILKVRGREEYLFGDYPLIQYVYIQESLSGSEVPNVVLKHIHTLSAYKSCQKQKQQLQQQKYSENSITSNAKGLLPYQQNHPHNYHHYQQQQLQLQQQQQQHQHQHSLSQLSQSQLQQQQFLLHNSQYYNNTSMPNLHFDANNIKPPQRKQGVVGIPNIANTSTLSLTAPKRPPKPESLRPKYHSSRTDLISWDITEKFKLRLHSIENVNCDLARATKVGIHIGLYHGERKLRNHRSVDMPISNNRSFNFEKELTFDINVRNLPRMTRLCMVIFEVMAKSSRSKKSSNTNKSDTNIYSNANVCVNPLAWANTTIFDYRDELRNGRLSFYTWTYADDIQSDDTFNPLGTIEPNPTKDGCAVVHLTFHTYGREKIYYPPTNAVLEYGESLQKIDKCEEMSSQNLKKLLSQYSRTDKIYEMHDQDRNEIWNHRFEIRKIAPDEIGIVLHCVNWDNRDEVSIMWNLLDCWPTISVERSLELLDYAYPDPAVRHFAIRCLRLLKDEELLLYLLQLVQAIKHESYLDCDLVEFILLRALRNQRIGHYFFWHLRSEMQTPCMQTRFGLLLEAYLKGCKPHVQLLRKQLTVLEKLKQGSELAKKGSKEKVRALLHEFLLNQRNSNVFQNIQNPLNPSFRCKGVKPEKCKVMDSKMRPLWIVFENSDHSSNDIYIIFKNGDDLRQDMLTLQMLRVMDTLWKNEGLDFRMNIYNCISMERRLGMIEVVLNAETIANIQKEKGMFSATSAFKKGSLYSWLREYNKSEEDMNKAVKEFTLSCAGYCVATYVLGVADRHSDNIMVKRNGQLFHIDFGHILGHFKEKFGVRRERVPFVLTHDFVYVINKGRTDREAVEFRYFQDICEKAFLVLRKHGCLILSLFSMMISTGLPELSSEKDLNYLKETLVLEYTEEKAREHFRSKFSEALANSWKTSLNWASHNFSKNNKQ